jgi:hypothetical protein
VWAIRFSKGQLWELAFAIYTSEVKMDYVKDQQLSPPDPAAKCRICECAAYSYATLENGLCDNCVEDYVCIECGEEMGEDQETDKYGYCQICAEWINS